ncbi:MAG TPA: lipase family protein [Sphingopyxis sp.]|nr:lipase family protein [Sphingopyxis sp.]HMP44738.1 lipase family protein [Sphingopyxis sp.]HMQ18632.1 lipase family protein [Sphingopyxis sp.]
MAGEANAPDFDGLAKMILYLESPRTFQQNARGAALEFTFRQLLTRDIEVQASVLSAEDKRRLASIVLYEGARRSVLEGMDERIRHALLTRRLVALGLMDRPRAIVEFASLPGTSPLANIWNYFGQIGAEWDNDRRDVRKAYMLACLSEIAYLYLTDRELEEDSRLRLFIPSRAGRLLHRHGARFTVEAIAQRAELPNITVLQSDRFAFFVMRFDKMAVITVRGTVITDRRDLKADFKAQKVAAAPDGFYHRGFYDEAEDKRAELVAAVGDASPLYITGHSLGAAMASVLCRIWDGPSRLMQPYVFSSPRFGTASVAKRLPRYAYLKSGDIVPKLPPKWMGYSDEGAEFIAFPNSAAKDSGWQEQLWFRQKMRAHSIEEMRVTLASEVVDGNADPHCYSACIAAEIGNLRAQGAALPRPPGGFRR